MLFVNLTNSLMWFAGAAIGSLGSVGGAQKASHRLVAAVPRGTERGTSPASPSVVQLLGIRTTPSCEFVEPARRLAERSIGPSEKRDRNCVDPGSFPLPTLANGPLMWLQFGA